MQADEEYVLVDANGNEVPISREEALAAGGEGSNYQKEVSTGGQDGERGFGKYLLGAAAGGLAYHLVSGMIKKKPKPTGYPQQGGYPPQAHQGYPPQQAAYGAAPAGYPSQQYQQPVQYQQQGGYPPAQAYGGAPMYPPQPQARMQQPQAGPGMASVDNPYQSQPQGNPCTTQIANPYQSQNPYQNAGMPQGYPPAGYSGQGGYPPQGYAKPF